jgi:hypothetical protein
MWVFVCKPYVVPIAQTYTIVNVMPDRLYRPTENMVSGQPFDGNRASGFLASPPGTLFNVKRPLAVGPLFLIGQTRPTFGC